MANRDKKNRSFEANRERFSEFDDTKGKKRDKEWRKAKKNREKAEKKAKKQAENNENYRENHNFYSDFD